MTLHSKVILITILAAIIGAVTVTGAERPDTAATKIYLGEVDVTAIKSIGTIGSDAPVAASRIGRSTIERLDIVGIKNASRLVPNLYMPDYGSRMTSSIYVRGLGARIDQPVVGLNIDNVAFLNKDNYDFDIPDISQIEVLRGPQSTFYGRNTMGGVINIHTLSPMEWQGTRVMATIAVPLQTKLALSWYGCTSDKFGTSLSAYYTHSDGQYRNTYNNSRIGTENAGSLRWKSVWRPSPLLSLENTAALQLNSQNGYPYEFEDNRTIAYNDTCFYHRVGFTDGLSVNWRPAANITLSSITGVQGLFDNMTLDNDFLPADYFTLTQRRHEWALTQDVIARGSAAAGRYKWLAGVFGFWRSSSTDAPVTFYDTGIAQLIEKNANSYNQTYPIRWDTRSFPLSSHFESPSGGIALYHESAIDFGNFTATAALRLDHERPSLSYDNECHTSYTILDLSDPSAPGIYGRSNIDIAQRGSIAMSFTELLPRFTLSYHLSRDMGSIYANVARGYKAGGYNTQMFSDVLQQELMGRMGLSQKYSVDEILSYRPESSWNYELGAHLRCPSTGIRVDVALFLIHCRDQQLTVFPDGSTTGRMMTNAGRTRSFGGELTLRYDLSPRWHFDASWGYTDARFTLYHNGINDLRGKRVPYAPSNTLWASIRHVAPINRGALRSFEASVHTQGAGPIYWDDLNTRRQGFYLLPGMTATLYADKWSVEVWGNNLSNTRYAVFSFTSIGHNFLQRGPGWRLGATLRLQL